MDSVTEIGKSELETVKVVVRVRPMSDKEIAAGYIPVVRISPERGAIELVSPKHSPKCFTFDAVYDCGTQSEIYDEVFRPLVDSVINGFNATIFAYGQTGAGKTYTMEGIIGDSEHEGLIPHSFQHIFSHIARSQDTQFLVSASYLEIYQEEVRDLLSSEPRKRLEVRERNDTGVYVKDLKVVICKTVNDLEKVMIDGKRNRSVGMTNMNAHSSRSHAIFFVSIESCESDAEGNQHVKIGKLHLVDLAGSEKQAKTGTVGKAQRESIKINLSLSALGNVISALVDSKSTHVPYRDSKLTRLLQDSLGGNAKTIMIANIGPASYNFDETLTTLRYANRAKNIKNKPVVNVDPKDAVLLQYQQEIKRLKSQLALKEAKRKKKRETAKIIEEEVIEVLEPSSAEVVKKMENLLEEERVAYLNEQNLVSEEKEKILRDIKAKDEELRLENEAKEKIKSQLQELEAKLLCGGKNIRDHTNEQQRVLEKRRQELAEQKCREREILKKLHEEEECTIEKKGTYDSLQQEVEVKTKKLKKLFQRFQALKEDINDEQEINSFERQEKEGTIETLTRDLKLSNLVIDNFINPEDKAKFLENVKYDEDEDCWIIYPSQSLSYSRFNPAERPTSANQFRRPTTSFAAKMNKLSSNPRFKSENIVIADFAMPRKRTIDSYEPDIDPYAIEAVRNLLSTAVFHLQTVDNSSDPSTDCSFSSDSLKSKNWKSQAVYNSSDPSTDCPFSPDSLKSKNWRSQTVDNSSDPSTDCSFSPDSLMSKNWRRARTSAPHSRQVKAKTDVEKYPVPRGLVPK